jgi:hypothetical protein
MSPCLNSCGSYFVCLKGKVKFESSGRNQGCQMVHIFSGQKYQFWFTFVGLGMANLGIFYGYFGTVKFIWCILPFTCIGYILWQFGTYITTLVRWNKKNLATPVEMFSRAWKDNKNCPKKIFSDRVARFFFAYDTKTGKNCTKWTRNVPNGHKISQMSLKCSKWP